MQQTDEPGEQLTRKQIRRNQSISQKGGWSIAHIIGVTLLSLLIIALLAICNIAIDSYANAKHAYARVQTATVNDDSNANENTDSTDEEATDNAAQELIDCLSDDPEVVGSDDCNNNGAAKSISNSKKTLSGIDDNLRKTGDRLESSIINSQKCSIQEWENAYDIHFEGCKQPIAGDINDYEWKLWEDALRDGDICIKTDAEGNKTAVMKEEC